MWHYVVVDNDDNNDKYNDDFPSLKKSIPSSSMDYSQVPQLIPKTENDHSKKKKKDPSIVNRSFQPSWEKLLEKENEEEEEEDPFIGNGPFEYPKEDKDPFNVNEEKNDLSQVGLLYALDQEKQSKSSPFSNTMVSSTATNSYKNNERSKKRVVGVLPPESTHDSIISIDPVVDLVDLPQLILPNRVDDQSKLLKKRVEFCLESDNLETNEVLVPVTQWNFESLSTYFDSISTRNVEVGSGSWTISTSNINIDSDRSNFGKNTNDVNVMSNQSKKDCVSTMKNRADPIKPYVKSLSNA